LELLVPDRALPLVLPVDLAGERAALVEARRAVQVKLKQLAGIRGGGADEFTDEYIAAVVSYAVERLQQELVVFGRIDDDEMWRVGLYGIDSDGRQLVVDWRAPFAAKFYQAGFAAPLGLTQRVSYVGSIDDLMVEIIASKKDVRRQKVSTASLLSSQSGRPRVRPCL
jgi:DNA helicase IV